MSQKPRQTSSNSTDCTVANWCGCPGFIVNYIFAGMFWNYALSLGLLLRYLLPAAFSIYLGLLPGCGHALLSPVSVLSLHGSSACTLCHCDAASAAGPSRHVFYWYIPEQRRGRRYHQGFAKHLIQNAARNCVHGNSPKIRTGA